MAKLLLGGPPAIPPRRFTAAELGRSRPFDRYLALKGAAGEAAVDAVLEALEAFEREPRVDATSPRRRLRKPEDAKALRGAVSAVLANLFAIARHQTHPGYFMALGFGAKDYPKHGPKVDRYKRSAMTITAMRAVGEFLWRQGLVEGMERGSYSRSAGRGYVARWRATDALVDFLEGHGVTLANVGSTALREVVILKGPAPKRGRPKPLVAYDDTAETLGWRAILTAVNDVLDAAAIDCPITQAATDTIEEPDLEDPEELDALRFAAGDRTAKALRRIFNDGSFERGGRLYGGYWEGCRKADRQRITIDGQTTIEADFASLHPHLLYAREGLTPPSDPYTVAIGGRPVDRDLGKVTFQRLINSTTAELPKRPAHKEDLKLLPEGVAFGDYVAAMVEMHRPIAHHFGTGVGLELQRTDSDIAMEVLADLTVGLGMVVLPIHDSFIVKADHEDALKAAMRRAYREVTGMVDCPPIKVT